MIPVTVAYICAALSLVHFLAFIGRLYRDKQARGVTGVNLFYEREGWLALAGMLWLLAAYLWMMVADSLPGIVITFWPFENF